MSVQLRNLHDGVPCVCTCCGEPIAATWPDGELSCACEWEGCDESCPVTGEYYRKARQLQDAGLSLVDEVRRLRAERAVMLDVILAADALIDTPTDDDVEDTALVDALIAALVRFDELPGDDR